LGLPQRLLEDHAQCQAKLDCQIRVIRLTTRGCSTLSRPQFKRVAADPDRQITAPPQALVVFRLVGHSLLLLRNFVASISVELVRHIQHPQENKP
jgi:hypothetical protein